MNLRQYMLLLLLLAPVWALGAGEPDSLVASRHLRIADSLKKSGQYDSAAVYYALAVEQSEAAKDWIVHVKALAGWCANESQRGDNIKAVPLGAKAVEVGIRELGKFNVDAGIAHYVAAYAYLGTSKYAEALSHFEASVTILDSLLDENDIRFAEVYEGFSEYYEEVGDIDKRIELLHRVLSIRQKNPDKEVTGIAITYSNLGLSYQKKGHHKRAAHYLAAAVDHQLRQVGEVHPNTAQMYNNLGTSYLSGGDLDRARATFRKALDIFDQLGGSQPNAAYAHNNIAMVYRLQKEFPPALKHGATSRDLFAAALGQDHPNVAGIVNNNGRTYFDMGNYRKAEELFITALTSWRNKLGNAHPLVAQSLYNLSDVAAKRKRYAVALSLLDSSLQIRTTALGARHPKVAEALRAQGNVYAAQARFTAALRSYQQALMVLVDGFTDSSTHSNPTLDRVDPRTLLLGTLASKAAVLLKRGRPNDLEVSLETYQLATHLIGRLRQGFSTEGAKLYLSTESFGVLEGGIAAALRLHERTGRREHLSAAFEFAEMGKAGMLSEALAEADARKFAGIPDSLLDVEQSLRDDIAFLDTQVQRLRQAVKRDSVKLREVERRLFDVTQQYQRLVARFEKEFPAYYQLKLRPSGISLDTLQTTVLAADEALLEYVVGDSLCYVIVVKKDGITCTTTRHHGKLTDNVLAFRNALRNLDFAGYTRSAHMLYRTLVAPVRSRLAGMKKLLIIPDGVLHHLPFEALLTKRPTGTSPDFARLPYLISEYDISYAMSASLLAGTSERHAERNTGFAGFAPVFADRQPPVEAIEPEQPEPKADYAITTRAIRLEGKTYPSLPESEREVREIARLFDARGARSNAYLHQRAVKSELKRVPQLASLHIASHGFIDEKQPKLSGILFAREGEEESSVLYSGEIYNLELNADLVVLSACESGLGKVVRGEGILGLTRGFLYAGARNIVVSLWQVADKSTADLMVEFYKGVLKGQPYSASLRNAKLALIKAGTYAYPLEWAPFVLVGR